MNKKELLKHFNVSSLADVSDQDLIKLAREGKLGEETMYSLWDLWMFKSEHDFAEHVRIALEKGKQLRTGFCDGEGVCPDKIEIDYV